MRFAASLILLFLSPLAHANGLLAGEPQATFQKAVDLLDPATIARVECDPVPSLGDADLSGRIRNAARRDIDGYALKPKLLAGRAEQSMAAFADPHAPDRRLLSRAYYAAACEHLNETNLPEIEIKAALNRIAETFRASFTTLAANKVTESAPAKPILTPPHVITEPLVETLATNSNAPTSPAISESGQITAATDGGEAPPATKTDPKQTESVEAAANELESSSQPVNRNDAAAEPPITAAAPQIEAQKPVEFAQAAATGPTAPVHMQAAVSDRPKQCDLPARIAVPHIAESVKSRALADADAAGEDLAQLTDMARRSLDELAGTYMTSRDILSSGYYQELCIVLSERGVIQTNAESALKEVATALNISHFLPGSHGDAAQVEEGIATAKPAPAGEGTGSETADQAAPPSSDQPQMAGAEAPAPSPDAGLSDEPARAPSSPGEDAIPPADNPAIETAQEKPNEDADAGQPSGDSDGVTIAETPVIEGQPAETTPDEADAEAATTSETKPDSPTISGQAAPAQPVPPPSAAAPANPADTSPSAETSDPAMAARAPGGTAVPPSDGAPQAGADEQQDRAAEVDAAEEETPAAPASADASPAQADDTAPSPAPRTNAGNGTLGDAECRALGVMENCPDLNAILGQLLEKPLEYNHPSEMLYGRNSEISLVLRTDWEGTEMPAEVSEEFKGLPGEVKQGISRITRVMSAELTGRDFEINPLGRQERTVILTEPVIWNWQVKPTETGPDQVLKLRLYAHLQGPGGTMPPILIKTLDANISVNVTTWDWLVISAKTLEPIYAIAAALLGLLTAILTYFLSRRRAAWEANAGSVTVSRRSEDTISSPGPVIGDINQSVSDSRPSQLSVPKASAPPALAVPPEKEQPSPEPEAIEPAAGEDSASRATRVQSDADSCSDSKE